MIDAKLTEHFSLEEMIRTSVRLPNVPGAPETDNLRELCLLLERLRDTPIAIHSSTFIILGGIFVHSGFRSAAVNAAVGGAKDSAHLDGRAVDFTAYNNRAISCGALVETIKSSALAFDKVIFESPATSTWVHLQIARRGIPPRGEALMCLQPGVYVPWNPAGLNGKVGQ